MLQRCTGHARNRGTNVTRAATSEGIDPALIEDPYPFQQHLGFRITDWREDFARFELPVAAHLGNRYNIPHGGVYASLIDTAMGFAGCYTGSRNDRRLAMTLSLNVNFLAQPKGTLLIAQGQRTGGGRKTFFAEAVIFDDTGIKVATGSGAFRYRSGGA